MTPEEQLEVVKGHHALNAMGDYPAAQELPTDDFSIAISPPFPLAGMCRGKGALRELIPLVVESITSTATRTVAATAGGGHAVNPAANGNAGRAGFCGNDMNSPGLFNTS